VPLALQRSVQDPLITGSIDRWIAQAHARITRDAPSLLFKVVVNGQFVVGQSQYLKPARWQTDLEFWYGAGAGFTAYSPLYLRPYGFCRLYWPDDTQTNPPVYYNNQFDYNNWLVLPTPDQAYPFEISYLESPQVIDINYQQNYLTEFMPEVLFKAVMLEASIDLHTQDLQQTAMNDYQSVLASWNAMDARRDYSSYTNRRAD